MRLLHENEIDFVLYLIDEGTEKEIDLEASERGPFLTPYLVQVFLNELSENGLIEINSVRIDFTKGHFLDGFLNSYTKLIQAGKIEEARNFAIQGNFSALNNALTEVKTIPEIWQIIEDILKDKGYLRDADFEKDLYESIFVKMKVKPQLNEYLNAYLEAYKNDELERPEPSKDKWEKVRYFENQHFRYKKQREIFLDLLAKKVDIQNPKSITIEYNKELPLENLNLTELILSLGKEGIIKQYKFETVYIINDINDFGGRDELWLSVDEDKIPNTARLKEIKLNLSFGSQTGIMTITDQNNSEYKIKIQGQVQREVLRVIFRNPENTYSEWNLSDISEILGGNDVDETSVKNAIYQFNKKVKLKIPEVDNLFELTKYSARINPKYINKK